MKPVMYLDVDGVLWDVDLAVAGKHGIAMEDAYKGANGLEAFITWALEHFEVRWLTAWAMGGCMDNYGWERLERYTGVPWEVWARVWPSKGWSRNKTEGIDWDEHLAGRPFVWVEDELLQGEMRFLEETGFAHRYYHTDVFDDPDALIKTHAKIRSLLERNGNDL